MVMLTRPVKVQKFEVFKDKGDQFRFRLKAPNGEIIAVGLSYPDKKSVLKIIASIQEYAPIARIENTTVLIQTTIYKDNITGKGIISFKSGHKQPSCK